MKDETTTNTRNRAMPVSLPHFRARPGSVTQSPTTADVYPRLTPIPNPCFQPKRKGGVKPEFPHPC